MRERVVAADATVELPVALPVWEPVGKATLLRLIFSSTEYSISHPTRAPHQRPLRWRHPDNKDGLLEGHEKKTKVHYIIAAIDDGKIVVLPHSSWAAGGSCKWAIKYRAQPFLLI